MHVSTTCSIHCDGAIGRTVADCNSDTLASISTDCTRLFQAGDLHRVVTGKSDELYAMIMREQRSVGCPTWEMRTREVADNTDRLSMYLDQHAPSGCKVIVQQDKGGWDLYYLLFIPYSYLFCSYGGCFHVSAHKVSVITSGHG